VHKDLICNYSEYFDRSCRSGFIETTTRRYDLKEDDPVAFALFVEWLYLHSRDKTATVALSQIDTKVWQVYAERAWVIADKLRALLFRDYAFAKVVQNANRMGSTRIAYIHDNADESSSIRIFVGELVRWRNLTSSLRYNTNALASQPGGGADPRRYPIQHWSEQCGQSGNLDCAHRPREGQNDLSFGLWYRKHKALVDTYAVLLVFLLVVFGLSDALIETSPDTPLYNFALFIACFAAITLGLTLLYIENADRGYVIAVSILNILFFFSTGCAVAVGAGSWCTDTTYWVRLRYLASQSDPLWRFR
jgi:hypothetical protein